jgi:hypothetical protein
MYVGKEVNSDKAKYTEMCTGQYLEGNNNKSSIHYFL